MLAAAEVRHAVATPGRAAALTQVEQALPQLREDLTRLAYLAASITGAAIGAVMLVGQDHLIIAASNQPSLPGEVSMATEVSTCAHVVAEQRPLVVPDCRVDARFSGNPLVQAGLFRSYAGVPLRDGSGHLLGTVCVFDPAPDLAVDQRALHALQLLAEQGSALLQQRHHRLLQQAQREVLESITAAHPLPQVLNLLAQRVESLLGGEVMVSVLLVDEDGATLRDAAGPSLPPAWREGIDGMPIGEGFGACGTAVHRRSPVSVDDIATDPKCTALAALASRHGLASCTSLPVLSHDGQALGTFALYRPTRGHRQAPLPSADLFEESAPSMTAPPMTAHPMTAPSMTAPSMTAPSMTAPSMTEATVAAFRDLLRVALERDRSHAELVRSATRDSVTGLLNRAAFLTSARQVLNQAPAPGRVHALLTCNVDDFKVVNDSRGHAAGDAYLAAIAEHLRSELRPQDVLARFAGDNFTIVLPDVPPHDVHAVADRVLTCFATPVPLPDPEKGCVQDRADDTDDAGRDDVSGWEDAHGWEPDRLQDAPLPQAVSWATGQNLGQGSGQVLELSASIGFSTTALSIAAPGSAAASYFTSGSSDGPPDDSCGLDDLLRDADLAMRAAKSSGRARVQACDAALRASTGAHRELGLALRLAVTRGEMEVHYQPEVDTRTGELHGFEALLRWSRPGHGPVSPVDFIPVAEANGLIIDIGRYVLDTACHQLADWRVVHPRARELSVWVNVSTHQLADPAFVETVTTALAQAGLPAAALGLEITESAVMGDVEAAAAVLARLRRVGVRIAVDDFGTGYSSLSVLKALPVDVVKIDRSFVNGLRPDSSDERLVTAIISMAHALDLHVVAEGVEHAHQHTLLRALGCDTTQGYLFGAPAHPADLTQILSTYHQRPPQPGPWHEAGREPDEYGVES